MTVRWNLTEGVSVVHQFTIAVTLSTTPAESSSFDDASIPEGHRVLIVWRNSGDTAGNTGGTLSVVKSVTTGGTFAGADRSVVQGGNAIGTAVQGGTAAYLPESDRPFTRLRFVGASALADVTITGLILAVRDLA
jgi:hypothetical protein